MPGPTASTEVAFVGWLHTRWFKLNDGDALPHEWRLHCPLHGHIRCIVLITVNSGRGWRDQFLTSGSRNGVSRENVSPPTIGLYKGQCWSTVSVGKKHLFSFLFWMSRSQVLYDKITKRFTQNQISPWVGPLECYTYRPMLNIQYRWIIKVEYEKYTRFRTKDETSTPFIRDRPPNVCTRITFVHTETGLPGFLFVSAVNIFCFK